MPTKKTVLKKKAPVKKVVSKKTTTKSKSSLKKPAVISKTPNKVLVCADNETCFWTTDGEILHDLKDLCDAFDRMSISVFSHHVNETKNDFADWVENILNDKDCAMALRKSKQPKTAKSTVMRHLRFYNI
jgi:hypothetical protein